MNYTFKHQKKGCEVTFENYTKERALERIKTFKDSKNWKLIKTT